MKIDPASGNTNNKNHKHHPKENDVIDLTAPNKDTSQKITSKNGRNDLVDLSVPTDYVSACDMAAIRKAERNGFDWEYWGGAQITKIQG